MTPPPARPRRPSMVLAALLIVAIVAALTLYRLGAADVCGSNEAVEGVFLQQMVEHGALLFPLENHRSPMYKPPLFHWTAVAIDRIAGIDKVTAFNLRLPAALYAIAGAALTMLFGASFLGGEAALLAGLILAGSYQYLENARIGRVDMTLCFFESLALFAFAWWQAPAAADEARRGSAGLRYLLAFAMGLAVLAMGPVGALLPGLAIVIFLARERRLRDLVALARPGPLLLGLALASSWYLACLFGRRYGFLDRQIGSENFGRFFGSLGQMAPWYYVKPILLNSAPLSLLAPFAVVAALRTGARTPATGAPPAAASSGRPAQNPLSLGMSLRMMFLPPMDPAAPAPAARRGALAMRLFAIFWLSTIVFFTVAAYKRRAYLLPLWPATALMLAWWLTLAGDARRLLRRAVVATCAFLIVFNLFYLPHHEVSECGGDSMRPAAAEVNRIVGRDEPLYLFEFEDEPATLLFYLDRPAPRIDGKLGDAPPGYIITTAAVWNRMKAQALDLRPVYTASSGRPRLVLLRHGKVYVRR